ncbi:MAG: hypothetical protein P8X57_10280, partial [Cyclobacteriaceae bacterium]
MVFNIRLSRKTLSIQVIVSLVVSFSIIMLDRSDWSYIFTFNFLLDMVITFISVVIVLLYIYWIIQWLNKKAGWKTNLLKRMILQSFFGLFIPALLALLLTWIQYQFI